ncbi:MAG: hypothetical protein H6772_03590 [Pseudomonadales bacterium]|nr:hypothetical protein [Pseudomonadales bacterium]
MKTKNKSIYKKLNISVFFVFFFIFATFNTVLLPNNFIKTIFMPHIVQAVELNIGDAAKSAAVPGTADYDSADPEGSFGILVGKALNIAIVIGAILVFGYLIWGGVEWITSGGDKGKIENARNRITQSIIGLLILASVVALFVFVQSFLGLEVLTFN